VKSLRSSNNRFAVCLFVSALCLWTILLAGRAAYAADAATKAKSSQETDAIKITSDRLIANRDSSWAEFSGNVRATQGDTVLTANSLKIYYRESMVQNTASSGAQGAVEKIVATGNVKIHFDGRLAESDQAVYTTGTRILVLSGAKSKVTSGKNSVSGKTITVDRNDDRITVEGGKETRVEAVIFSGKNGIE